jgi:hypothetical protein
MKKRKIGLSVRLVISIGCFIMAVLAFLGVGTRDEPHGELFFGLAWTCIGVLSAIRYVMEKNKNQSRDAAHDS